MDSSYNIPEIVAWDDSSLQNEMALKLPFVQTRLSETKDCRGYSVHQYKGKDR